MAKSKYAGYTSREPSDYEKTIIDTYFDVEMVKNFDDYRYSIVSAPNGSDSEIILVVLQLKNEGSFNEESRKRILEVAKGLLLLVSEPYKFENRELYTLERLSNNSVVLTYIKNN